MGVYFAGTGVLVLGAAASQGSGIGISFMGLMSGGVAPVYFMLRNRASGSEIIIAEP